MHRRGTFALVSLTLAACTALPAAGPATTAPASTIGQPAPSISAAPSTTTTSPPSTTTTIGTTTSTQPRGIDAVVVEPEGPGPHPAVVLVHGGSWIAGSPESLSALAEDLAANGYLVVNTRYRLATLRAPSFPHALDDVACAVRHAAHHPRSDGTVALVGHSAGAHLAAVVALTGTAHGGDCDETRPAQATRLVGLAGPYDVTRVGLLVAPFFGVRLADDPDTWAQGNPLALVAPDAGVSSLLIHGEADAIVDLAFAESFADALADAGLTVDLEVVEGASHMAVTDPVVVGAIVLEWLGTH